MDEGRVHEDCAAVGSAALLVISGLWCRASESGGVVLCQLPVADSGALRLSYLDLVGVALHTRCRVIAGPSARSRCRSAKAFEYVGQARLVDGRYTLTVDVPGRITLRQRAITVRSSPRGTSTPGTRRRYRDRSPRHSAPGATAHPAARSPTLSLSVRLCSCLRSADVLEKACAPGPAGCAPHLPGRPAPTLPGILFCNNLLPAPFIVLTITSTAPRGSPDHATRHIHAIESRCFAENNSA